MSPYEPDRSVGLPVGTRVCNRRTGSRQRFGTVMPYEPEWSHGRFPVRWDDQFWQICNASEVTVVSDEGNGHRRVDRRLDQHEVGPVCARPRLARHR